MKGKGSYHFASPTPPLSPVGVSDVHNGGGLGRVLCPFWEVQGSGVGLVLLLGL